MSDGTPSEPEVLPPLKRRGRPKGLPKTGGRKPGVKNKVSPDLRQLILERGKPIELLCDISRGVKIRVGPQAGPGDPQYQYPTLQERAHAAKLLLDKLVPSAPTDPVPGKPIQNEDVSEVSDIEAARQIAFMFNSAARKMLPPGSPTPESWAATKAVVAGDPDWQSLPEEIEAREKEDSEWRARFNAKPLSAVDPQTAEAASAAASARWAGPDQSSQEYADAHINRVAGMSINRHAAPKVITSNRFRNR